MIAITITYRPPLVVETRLPEPSDSPDMPPETSQDEVR